MTRYAVLGTGTVGRAIAGKLAELGHEVRMGTRDVDAARARTEPDPRGGPSFAGWLAMQPVSLVTFADAAAASDVLVNATLGVGSVDAIGAAAVADLDGKVLIDISNPLDFSIGELRLTVGITDSLGETIQRAFPSLRVVKTLNTVSAPVMVDPASVGEGHHTMFVGGNDPVAKAEVSSLLTEGFGWRDVRDLGDITAARGMEAYLLLWLRAMQTFGTAMFNVKVVS